MRATGEANGKGVKQASPKGDKGAYLKSFEMTVETMLQAAEQEEQSDDEPQEESGTPGSRKREREPKLGARIFTRSEQSTLRNAFIENPYPSRRKLNALADEFDKPLNKVKTWFNNRRAKQRRLRCDNSSAGDSKPETEQNPKQENQLEGVQVKEEPTSALDSPMTPGVPASSAAGSSFNRRPRKEQHEKAPPPATLKTATLTVGSHVYKGSEEDLSGNGLEIKFLFGRRRIVYEFCARDRVEEVYRQGGPFYRVEVLFDKIENITFDEDGASEIRLVLNSLPEFSVQPASNFKEYRERMKQRLYVRTEDKRLAKIFSESSEHIIRFKEPKKSLLVRSKLMQLEPQFQRILARGSGSKTEKLTQDLELECVTPPYSVAGESAGLAASKGTPTQLASVKKSLDFEGRVSPSAPLFVPRLPPIQEGRAPAKVETVNSRLSHGEGAVVPGISPAKAEVGMIPRITPMRQATVLPSLRESNILSPNGRRNSAPGCNINSRGTF